MNQDIGWMLRVVTFVAAFGFIQQLGAQSEDRIGMVTGGPGGTYIVFGRDIANIARPVGLNIWVRQSGGSLDNINLMDSSENAALGIVQSDVLSFLDKSTNPRFKRTAKRLRLIFPLYNEEVHLFARKEIQRFEDLNDKRVVVGTEGSGNFITATNLLNIAGIKVSESIKNLKPVQAMAAVLVGNADAMFYVTGKPAEAFKRLQDMEDKKKHKDLLDDVHFVPIAHESMLKEYVVAEIGPEDYGWLHSTIPTIAVQAALVSFDFSNSNAPYYRKRCAQLNQLAEAIRNNLLELRDSGHEKWKKVDLEKGVGIWELDTCSHPRVVGGTEEEREKTLAEELEDIIMGK